MTGDTVIQLADQIVEARATFNEAVALCGPLSEQAHRAKLELIRLQRAGKELMA